MPMFPMGVFVVELEALVMPELITMAHITHWNIGARWLTVFWELKVKILVTAIEDIKLGEMQMGVVVGVKDAISVSHMEGHPWSPFGRKFAMKDNHSRFRSKVWPTEFLCKEHLVNHFQGTDIDRPRQMSSMVFVGIAAIHNDELRVGVTVLAR